MITIYPFLLKLPASQGTSLSLLLSIHTPTYATLSLLPFKNVCLFSCTLFLTPLPQLHLHNLCNNVYHPCHSVMNPPPLIPRNVSLFSNCPHPSAARHPYPHPLPQVTSIAVSFCSLFEEPIQLQQLLIGGFLGEIFDISGCFGEFLKWN